MRYARQNLRTQNKVGEMHRVRVARQGPLQDVLVPPVRYPAGADQEQVHIRIRPLSPSGDRPEQVHLLDPR